MKFYLLTVSQLIKLESQKESILAAARDADKTFREQVCGPAQDILREEIK
jgi:hypothetical protein